MWKDRPAVEGHCCAIRYEQVRKALFSEQVVKL